VCPLLSERYSDNSGSKNGVLKSYLLKNSSDINKPSPDPVINNPGSGHVSLCHLPSRDESGSHAQFSNNDAKGNSVFGIFSDHFKHVFSAIGPTGAEIRPVKGLDKKLFYVLPFVTNKRVLWVFRPNLFIPVKQVCQNMTKAKLLLSTQLDGISKKSKEQNI
jgi:hypothetical protein